MTDDTNSHDDDWGKPNIVTGLAIGRIAPLDLREADEGDRLQFEKMREPVADELAARRRRKSLKEIGKWTAADVVEEARDVIAHHPDATIVVAIRHNNPDGTFGLHVMCASERGPDDVVGVLTRAQHQVITEGVGHE